MKSLIWGCRAMEMGSAWGVEAPSLTRTTTAATATTGATVCMTTHNWQ